MGNLYGSEYWTYLLPRRVDPAQARAVVDNRLPIGARRAMSLGLVDDCLSATPATFFARVEREAEALTAEATYARLMGAKLRQRAVDEEAKPLERYRDEELRKMKLNFYGFDSSYHVARHDFVYKRPRSRTPSHLAAHRFSR
jgi:putative two-component system hydrogenase maturation factor HypX/HoxX